MKAKLGFISNSSSCSFVIKNQTDEHKDIRDFAKETLHLVLEFNEQYDHDTTIESFMNDCNEYYISWEPGETRYAIFGDEDGTDMGRVYDYMLRDADYSKSFS
jgi:hypothetical protein